MGSTQGGYLTLKGKYFYNDINVPAKIEIGGEACSLIDFQMTNLPDTQFTCEFKSQQNPSSNEYYGNRGINFIRDDVYTLFANLASVTPSANARYNITNQMFFNENRPFDSTVWFRGYFKPKISSNYLFSINTNGSAILFVSTDSSSANKVLISSYNELVAVNGTVLLQANKKYI